MAIKQSEIKDLLIRVRRLHNLGWRLEESNGNADYSHRIVSPSGRRVQIHRSPSDRNWLKALIQDLNDLGFADDEVKEMATREEMKKQNLALLREKEKLELKKAAERARQEEFRRSIAGPYEAQPADPEWIFKPHVLPETRRVLIDWKLSERILNELNPSNRPLRKGRVTYWANIIRRNRWRYTHQGMAINTIPALQDGQHRLAAAAQEKFTLDINVSVGMPPENFGAIDVGIIRSHSDTLAVLKMPNPTALAGASRLVTQYDKYGSEMRLGTRTKIPNDEFSEATEIYGQRLVKAVAEATAITHRKGTPYMSRNALAAGIYLIGRALRENDARVIEFIRGYTEGTDLKDGDARIALRSYMYNLRSSEQRSREVRPVDQLGVFLKAWKDWVQGNTRQNMTFRKNELMPIVFVPPPREE